MNLHFVVVLFVVVVAHQLSITCIEYFLSVLLSSFIKIFENLGEWFQFIHYSFWLITHVFPLCLYILQIRAGQRSITPNLWPLTTHIFHVMIIVTSEFSKKYFLILFPINSFEQSFFLSWNLNTFKHKFLLFFSVIFYLLFRNQSVH